jgi:hypothetical protein
MTANRSNKEPRLSQTLDDFVASITTESVDLATIVRFMGRRSIAALLILLALPMAVPMPAPGISVIFGIPLIVISAQLLLGRRTAWLPARLARRSVKRADLALLVARALPRLRAFERVVRPRLEWMAGNGATVPIGAVCLLLAIIITLPIPLGNVFPGFAIVIMALGILERDGIAVGLGLLVAVGAVVIVALASAGLVTVLRPWFAV